MKGKTPNNSSRRGVAAVEFAVVLPLIVLFLLGSIEAGRTIMVTHSLQEAAQAACRVYSVRDTTRQDAQDIVDASMAEANIQGYSVQFDPLTKAEIDVFMEPVSVTVSVPYERVRWISPWFMASSTVTGRGTFPADVENEENTLAGYDPLDDDHTADGNARDYDGEIKLDYYDTTTVYDD